MRLDELPPSLRALHAATGGPWLLRRDVSIRCIGWSIGEAPLEAVANNERMMPREFISEDGFHITEAARRYLQPLIAGEAYPAYRDGLPDYFRFKPQLVAPRTGRRYEAA